MVDLLVVVPGCGERGDASVPVVGKYREFPFRE